MSETSEERPGQRPGLWAAGRHAVNVGHLVMGLAFLGLVGIWALYASGAVASDDLHWLLPVPWVVAGAAGLVATTVNGAARRERWERWR